MPTDKQDPLDTIITKIKNYAIYLTQDGIGLEPFDCLSDDSAKKAINAYILKIIDTNKEIYSTHDSILNDQEYCRIREELRQEQREAAGLSTKAAKQLGVE